MKEVLSADLVPQILADNPSILLVKIHTVNLVNHGNETPAVDTGTVNFEIVEVLRAPAPAPAGVIEVPARRISDPIKRNKYGFDEWNNLELNPGDFLLLACQPLTPPAVWKALAARQVESATSADVAAARRCIAIQKFAGPLEGKAELTGKALKSKDELLRNYATALAADGKTFPPEMAAGLVASAINAPELDGTEKLELGAALSGNTFFKYGDKTTGANPIVLTALSQGLVNATDTEQRMEWVQYLASCVLGTFADEPAKNRTIRLALVRKCPAPLPAQVKSTLTGLAHQCEPDEQKRVRELLDVWAASGSAP